MNRTSLFYSVSVMLNMLRFVWHGVLVLFFSSFARMPSGKANPTHTIEFREEPMFSQNKVTLYEYEAYAMIRRPENDFGRTGINLFAKLEIRPHGQRTYEIKAVSVNIKEVTGAWPKDPSTRASKRSQTMSDQFLKPVRFEYDNGRIRNIFAPSDVSETALNLIRGILSLFIMNLKKSQNVYDLQESSVGGVCHTRYVIPEQKQGDELLVVKSIDFNNCEDKVIKNVGMAFMDHCEPCQRMHRHVHNTATSTIKLKNNIIKEVALEQIIFYTPLQERNGGAVMKAKQVLTWAGTRSSQSNPPQIEFQKRGNVHYNFEDEINQIPFVLLKTKSLEAQIEQAIQHMGQYNQEKIHQDVSVEFMQMLQLLRRASLEILHTIWKQFAQKTRHRTWFLEGLRMAGTVDSLKFAQQIFHSGELTDIEATVLIPLAMHVTRGSQQALEISKELIQDPKIQKNPTLYKHTVLAYGSMVNKYCLHLSTCPESALEPLHDLAADALSKVHEEEMSLALKALGNAGQDHSVNCILKFLPGISSSAAQLPIRVKVDAVMALRNIARRDPRKVQEILMQVYMDRKVPTEVRMMGCLALFETEPGPDLITNIANVAVRESNVNLQFVSFVYSQLKALAKSSIPQLEPLAAACNVALKLFNPNLDNLGHSFSRVIHMDTFKYSLMSGAAAKIYVMNNPNTLSPVFMLMKVRAYIDDSEVDVIEIGIRAEGLTDILRRQDLHFGDLPMHKKISQILKLLKGFNPQSTQSPLFSWYTKGFSQEMSFSGTNDAPIQSITRALNEPAERHAAIKKTINGLIGQFARAIVAVTALYITPATIGLPVEISWYTTAEGNASVNIGVKMIPSDSPDFSFAQLLDSLLQINADINPRIIS